MLSVNFAIYPVRKHSNGVKKHEGGIQKKILTGFTLNNLRGLDA